MTEKHAEALKALIQALGEHNSATRMGELCAVLVVFNDGSGKVARIPYPVESWGDIFSSDSEEEVQRLTEKYGTRCVCCGQKLP